MTGRYCQTLEGVEHFLRRGVPLEGPWLATALRLNVGQPLPPLLAHYLADICNGKKQVYFARKENRAYSKLRFDAILRGVYRSFYKRLTRRKAAWIAANRNKHRKSASMFSTHSLSDLAATMTSRYFHKQIQISPRTIQNRISRTR